MTNPSQYASEIYLAGMGGARPAFTTDLTALEAAARDVLAPEPFWYVAGAATSGSTAVANRAAFDDWRIVPRMLTGATVRDLTTTVLGSTLPTPVITAPVGVQSIVHPDAELGAARVTAELGIPMILSTVSSFALEDVAEANGDGTRWFQLYWPNDEAVCLSLLDRAKNAGFTALFVTLDTWSLGWRPHRSRQRLPAIPHRRGAGQLLARPRVSGRPGEAAERGSRGCADALAAHVHRHGPHLGPGGVPARALGWAGGPEGNSARRRRAARRRRRRAGDRRLQPRGPPGGWRDRLAGCAARYRRRGRRPAGRLLRLGHSAPAPTFSRPSPSARRPCWSVGPGSTAWRSAAPTECGTCCAACSRTSTSRCRCPGTTRYRSSAAIRWCRTKRSALS